VRFFKMKKDTNNNYFFIAIVAIVAIVGMTFMAMNVGSKYSSQDATYAISEVEGDLAGQAVTKEARAVPRDTLPELECYSDADCDGDLVCINNECLMPTDIEEEVTTYPVFYGFNFDRYQPLESSNYISIGASVQFNSNNFQGENYLNAYSDCFFNGDYYYHRASASPDVYDLTQDSSFTSYLNSYASTSGNYFNVRCGVHNKEGDVERYMELEDFPKYNSAFLYYLDIYDAYILSVDLFTPYENSRLVYSYSVDEEHYWNDIEIPRGTYKALIPLNLSGAVNDVYMYLGVSSFENYDAGLSTTSIGIQTMTSFWYSPVSSKSDSVTETVTVNGQTYNVIPINYEDEISEERFKEISELLKNK
jgi:hypothetical protein